MHQHASTDILIPFFISVVQVVAWGTSCATVEEHRLLEQTLQLRACVNVQHCSSSSTAVADVIQSHHHQQQRHAHKLLLQAPADVKELLDSTVV
jgi:hypothetical protein